MALLYEFTSSKYFPEDSDIEDQFEIKHVEPGKVWLEGFGDGRFLGPINLPVEATKLCFIDGKERGINPIGHAEQLWRARRGEGS